MEVINAKINFKSIQFLAPTHYQAWSQVEQVIGKGQKCYSGHHDRQAVESPR